MKFGHFVEHSMIRIFLENTCTKCGGETVLRSFSKKLKLSKSLQQWSKVLYSLSLWYAKLNAIQKY